MNVRTTGTVNGKAALRGHQCQRPGLGSLAASSWRSACGHGAVMGIRLVCEVLDHYHGPDARKLWLISWAEKANDGTRAGWPTREVLSHRTGRSPSRVSHISDELIAEGVLKRDGGGNRSGPARFILLPLDTAEMGAHSAHPKAEVKSAPSTHPSAGVKDAVRSHPKPKVKGAESARKGAESARKGADPISLPAETGSLPLSIPSEVQPSSPSADAKAPTAQTIVARFIDWVRADGGDLTERTIGILAKQIGDLLRQGKPEKPIRQALAAWYEAGQNPATFDSFVNTALRGRSAQNGNGPKRAHRPYQNPADDSAYEEPI